MQIQSVNAPYKELTVTANCFLLCTSARYKYAYYGEQRSRRGTDLAPTEQVKISLTTGGPLTRIPLTQP